MISGGQHDSSRDVDDHVVSLCSQLIRFDTTNRGDGDAEGEREAAEFVAEQLTNIDVEPIMLESAPRRTNVIARIPGTEPDRAALLVHGHLDVVPADAADWSKDPFSGEVCEGFIWGRGALDMKGMCAQVLTVVSEWARTGGKPRRDIVLAFVADEEDSSNYGANWLVAEHPELFDGCTEGISEFGGFSYPIDGVRLYPVATAERGSAWMKLTAKGIAGHASRRNPDNAVTRLAAALTRLAEHAWPVHVTPAVRAFLEQAGKALNVTADLSDVNATLARLGGAATFAESVLRNSTTPTMMQAGYKINVIPATAVAYVDGRVLPGMFDDYTSTVDALLGPGVTREFVNLSPPAEAPVDGPLFDAMTQALTGEDPDAVVVPYCMGGGTDAKAFATLGIAGYGFTPLLLPEGFDYRSRAHGIDERVPVDGLRFGVRVLDRFLTSC